jgi:hypothetical protein
MHRARGMAVLAVCVAALSLGGCQTVIDQGAVLLGDSRPLPAQPSPPPGVVFACMEALATGTLRGDPADPSLVWLENGAERTELVWPFGFRVRFAPGAEVLAPGGRVVARDGQTVSLGGGEIDGAFQVCTIPGEDLLDPAQ